MCKIESRKSKKSFLLLLLLLLFQVYRLSVICLLVCSSSHFTISHITSSPLCNYINLSVSSTIIASYLLKRKEWNSGISDYKSWIKRCVHVYTLCSHSLLIEISGSQVCVRFESHYVIDPLLHNEILMAALKN